MTLDLFTDADLQQPAGVEPIGAQSCVLRGFALPWVERLLPALDEVLVQAPFRQMFTPGGLPLSASLSSCGTLGWISDRNGYRYTGVDPQNGRPWPTMPEAFQQIASEAAHVAGFAHFVADACLINRYLPGAKMSLHQDRNERDFSAPVVSVSLGLPAIFLFGGDERSDKTQRISLFHGDIVVWGGVDRLRFHGVLPIKHGHHPQLGAKRLNFTLRTAG